MVILYVALLCLSIYVPNFGSFSLWKKTMSHFWIHTCVQYSHSSLSSIGYILGGLKKSERMVGRWWMMEFGEEGRESERVS